MRCEDYPCCGHGEAGDGGPCPDDRGRFPCLGCGKTHDPSASGSSYCLDCLDDPRTFHDPDCLGCDTCDPEPEAKACGCWSDEVCDECDDDEASA